MKKARKCIVLFLSITLIFSSFSLVSSAHEFSPARYPRRVYRDTSMNIGVAQLTYYISNFSNSNYLGQLRSTIHDWEWEDAGHVEMLETSQNSAQVRFYDTWDNQQFGSTAYAVTVPWTMEGTARVYGAGWTQPIYSKKCKIIVKNEVYVNYASQKKDNFSNYDIRKTWAHEIGHCLGFNETNDGTRTIMRQGKGSTFGWINYWLPQDHDRSDLKSKFGYTLVP